MTVKSEIERRKLKNAARSAESFRQNLRAAAPFYSHVSDAVGEMNDTIDDLEPPAGLEKAADALDTAVGNMESSSNSFGALLGGFIPGYHDDRKLREGIRRWKDANAEFAEAAERFGLDCFMLASPNAPPL